MIAIQKSILETLFPAISILLLFLPPSFAQEYPRLLLLPGQSQISGGLGISWITENGQTVPYYMIGVIPDLQFGEIGIGLDLTLRINTTDGKILKEDWSDGAYRKVIRYVSWGQKDDPLYAQVGQMDMATLGHGFIIYDYNNSASFDDRRVGAELDVDLTDFGFEAIYGDFQTPGLMGGRFYVRPLKFAGLGEIPIIGGTELGATYVTDQSNNSSVVLSPAKPNMDGFTPIYETKGRMSEYGFDAGLPVLRTTSVDADFYYDYAQFVNFGHGNAVGILGTFRGLGIANASVRLEHQWIGNEFISGIFQPILRARTVHTGYNRFHK